ncbi:MAG: formyl transferase [Exilibacterium sp.]
MSDKVGGKRPPAAALGELKFFEQSLFNKLLFPLIDNQSGAVKARLRGFDALARLLVNQGADTEVNDAAANNAIATLNEINTPAGLHRLEETAPDLIISIRYGVILKREAIAIPKYGVLNLHSGLLPQYQGVMATFRALLNGDREIGSTLHYIVDSSIDTGPIIDQAKVQVDRQRSYLWHVLQLYPGGCEMIVNAVSRLAEKKQLSSRAQERSGNYYSFPTKEELKEFERRGFKLFDVQEVLEFAMQYLN